MPLCEGRATYLSVSLTGCAVLLHWWQRRDIVEATPHELWVKEKLAVRKDLMQIQTVI